MSLNCARCASAIPQEQIERDEAIRFAGDVYCPVCAAKVRLVSAVVCPRCQGRDLPLFDGVTMICRRCGGDLPHAGRAEPHTHAAPTAAPSPTSAPSFNRKVAAAAGGLFAAGAALLVLWRVLGGAPPPSAPARSPAVPAEPDVRIERMDGRLQTLKDDIAAARAEWDAALRRIEEGRHREEALASEARRALAARIDGLADQLVSLQRRAEELENRASARLREGTAPPPAESPAEAEARRAWKEVQLRRAPLLEERRNAAALAELLQFPETLSATAAGREAAKLAEWERKNIVKNLYPAEKDRAEAHVVKGETLQAIQAYRDIEKRLGIPELLPEIRARLTDLEARRKARPPAPAAGAPAASESEIASWIEDFGSIARASAASEKLLAAGKAGADALLEALGHASPDVRRHAAMALAKAREPRAAEAILARLADPDPWNRQVYITALGDLGNAAAAPSLVERLEKGDPAEARAAHEALERLSGKKASIPFSDSPADRGALALFWRGWLESTQKK